MKSREPSLITSPFLGVLCAVTPGCWLHAGRCRALPSPHAGCVEYSALGVHSQPGNGPLHKPQCRLCGQGSELTPSPTALRCPCLQASVELNATVRWVPPKWVKSAWEKLREGRTVLKWITALGGWRWNLFQRLFQLNLSQHLIWVSCKNN